MKAMGNKSGHTAAMVVARAVFHAPMSWLKAVALWLNTPLMFATRAVFHEPMFVLKAFAPLNMFTIHVTLAKFHEPMSWLKAEAP